MAIDPAILAISDFFRDSNYAECALWIAIGFGFLVRAGVRFKQRGSALIAGVTLLLFGLSDFIEAGTGAWWRPWWLLLWKAACLLVFLILIVRYVRSRRISPGTPVP